MIDARRTKLAELQNKVNQNNIKAKGIIDANDAAGVLETPEQQAQLKALDIERINLHEEIDNLKAVIAMKGAFENPADPAVSNNPGHGTGTPGSQQQALKSIGERFAEFKPAMDYLKSLGGLTGGQTQFNTPKMEISSFGPRNAGEMQDYMRTLITGASGLSASAATSGGALVVPQYTPIVDQFYQRPLMIRDLITNAQTESDIVFWVKITSVTNNAAPVAEAANATFGNGSNGSGQKPESAMTFEQEASTVKTIAHWIPVTSRALSDAKQLRSYIDQFMRYGIDLSLENEIMNGAGTGEHFLGVLSNPDIQTQAFVTDLLITARKARTKVRVGGRAIPTGYVLHPVDVETLDTIRESTDLGSFYGMNPLSNNNMTKRTLWGLPVVESEAVNEGTGVCADWRQAILWDREESAISVSNSHNDFFTRNLVAILGEMRAAFGMIRPEAFVEFDTQEAS